MVTRALLYVPDAEAGVAARAIVGGQPVLVRLLLAAQRAGVEWVALPGAVRGWGLPADPRLRALVVWLDELDEAGRASWQDEPLLLLPPTVLVDAGGLRVLLAEPAGPHACAVAETKGLSSPVLLAPPELVRLLWDRLAGGLPVGDDLEAAVRRRATRWVTAGGLCAPVGGAAQRADAESGLYASLGIAADSLVDRLVHRRISRILTRVLVRLGLTPNQVTLASLLAGVTAAWLLWDATPLAACLGVVAYSMAVVLDHADGDVARLTFQESRVGAWLDVLVDGLVQTLVMLALGVTASRVGGLPVLVAGIVAGAGAMLSAVLAARFGVGPGRHAGVGGVLDRLGNRDFVYLVLAVFVAGVWLTPAILPPLVLVLAVGSQAFWLGCLWRSRRGGRR
jgi:phosphatidylglycerophosphate synthase